MQLTVPLSEDLAFISLCSPVTDREVLIELLNGNIAPARAPAVLDFVGRSYHIVEKDARFHSVTQRFFADVIWKRFQKVVWSEHGTVGIDVPIEPSHVKTFLNVVKLKASSPKYVDNLIRYLTKQAENLG